MKTLSPTEEKVLHATLQGKTNDEIAGSFFRSPHTIKTHIKRIKAKLGAKNMAEATCKYLLSIDDPKKLLKALLFLVIQLHVIINVVNVDMRMARRAGRTRVRTSNVRKNKTDGLCFS